MEKSEYEKLMEWKNERNREWTNKNDTEGDIIWRAKSKPQSETTKKYTPKSRSIVIGCDIEVSSDFPMLWNKNRFEPNCVFWHFSKKKTAAVLNFGKNWISIQLYFVFQFREMSTMDFVTVFHEPFIMWCSLLFFPQQLTNPVTYINENVYIVINIVWNINYYSCHSHFKISFHFCRRAIFSKCYCVFWKIVYAFTIINCYRWVQSLKYMIKREV